MTIAAILRDKGGEVISIAGDMTVGEAVTLLAGKRIGALPVVDGPAGDGGVAGIFSERDVIRALQAHGNGAMDRRVAEVMSAPAITVTPEQSVIGALSLMTQRRFRHLPVEADGKLVGFVSIGDLVKYRIDRIEADAAAMRDYIQSA